MRAFCLLLLCALSNPVLAASFATQVVVYTPGSNIPVGYDDPLSSLGEPARSTGTGPFDGDVTPFNAPYRSEHVVAIGAGGELVVRFDQLVVDSPANPFGIDLLIYGNAFLGIDFDTGLANGELFAEPARIALSADGVFWVDVIGSFADALFPTLAFQDPPGPFSSGGTIPTSFYRAVNPALSATDFIGLDTAQIAALYGGAAGGVGIDLGPLGLSSIEYVRIWQPGSDAFAAEIDAIVAVPEPAALALVGVGALALALLRARAVR